MKNKKLILPLLLGLLILGFTTSYGQTIELVGKQLIYDGVTYKAKEASSIFEQVPACLHPYDLYLAMHKRKNFYRATGLVLLGAGVTIHLLTVGQGGDKQAFHERLGRSLPLLLFGGVGSALLLSSTARPTDQLTTAIDCFDARDSQSDHSLQLQFGATSNGIRLVCSF